MKGNRRWKISEINTESKMLHVIKKRKNGEWSLTAAKLHKLFEVPDVKSDLL